MSLAVSAISIAPSHNSAPALMNLGIASVASAATLRFYLTASPLVYPSLVLYWSLFFKNLNSASASVSASASTRTPNDLVVRRASMTSVMRILIRADCLIFLIILIFRDAKMISWLLYTL